MGRRRTLGRERTALPPLFDKQVEIVNIRPATSSDVEGSTANIWIVRLIVDGRPYRIKMLAQDEFDVMQRLITMQNKKPKFAHK